MDLGSVLGIVGGFVVIAFGLLSSADKPSDVAIFVDVASAIIVFGGALTGMLASYTLPQFIASLKSFGLIFKAQDNDPTKSIEEIIELANLARREGILALEERTGSMEDEFLQKGIMLVVDGTDPELVRSILETELSYIEARHGQVAGFWDNLGALGPAWGMIGTVIGLILMLLNMDPDTLGANMAVALITTFYGSVISSYLCSPVANKLRILSSDEVLIKEVLIEGVLSIQAGENPRIIEEKLKSFFAKSVRDSINTGGEY